MLMPQAGFVLQSGDCSAENANIAKNSVKQQPLCYRFRSFSESGKKKGSKALMEPETVEVRCFGPSCTR